MVTLEQLLDKIAESILLNINEFTETPTETLRANQKTIRQGLIQTGLSSERERLLLFQSDAKANEEDNINNLTDIVNELNVYYDTNGDQIPDAGIISTIRITISPTATPYFPEIYISDTNSVLTQTPITEYIYDVENNPLNIGQFIQLQQAPSLKIDPDKANEFLDTDIYELLPDVRTRQQRIDDFFKEFQELSGQTPEFQEDEYGDIFAPPEYSEEHDISTAQDGDPEIGIEEEDSFITRLNIDANSDNSDKTLESLRDNINEYLKDIDQIPEVAVSDERPEYENKSDGYIKIRNLNQGIIVRKQEGDMIGLEKQVENDLHISENHMCYPGQGGGPSYLCDGFTISMWVRFLDKTSKGTLFNYANPFRSLDPKGIKLETFIIDKDQMMESENQLTGDDSRIFHTWGELAQDLGLNLFQDSDSERFIRLVVRDHLDVTDNNFQDVIGGRLYDSHIGTEGFPRDHYSIPEFGKNYTYGDHVGFQYGLLDEKYLLTHTRVPIDFDEWYFIVANYNPGISDTIELANTQNNSDFWRGNVNADGTYTHYSGYGAKCKVEIISRSDLLRARGYKPE